MWLSEPWCRDLAASLREHASINDLGVSPMVAVQCTSFEKSPTNNWLVSLHQDLSVPVKDRVTTAGLSGWSTKEHQLFVQPPTSVLEDLIAVRVHLDDCGPDAGGLRVVPGSHRFGRLDMSRAASLRAQYGEIAPEAARGSVLAMRPLLLHASSKATVPSSRRVLHFLFGPRSLPLGLTWGMAV